MTRGVAAAFLLGTSAARWMKITVGLNEGFSFYLYLSAIKMDFAGNVMSFLVHVIRTQKRFKL